MERVSATEVARRFSELLDAVEHQHRTFVVQRHGRDVARIAPAPKATGATVKELVRRAPADRAWIRELGLLRGALEIEERPWNG